LQGVTVPVVLPLVVLLVSLGLLLVYLFARLAMRGSEHPLKNLRYEAGNPPRGRARRPILKQYYAYILLFLVVEPLLVLLYLVALTTPSNPVATGGWILLSTGIVTPILVYTLRKMHEGGV